MTQILSKIGKIISLIHREGMINAFRRVLYFAAGSFRKVGSGQILYINGGLGDNALYRGQHIAEELNAKGFVAVATIQDNPFLRRYIKRFDVFVLHRVVCSGHIMRFLEAAKKAGKTVIFETDDLVFDADLMQSTDAYANMNVFERTQYAGGLSSCIVEDAYVTHATTTTEPLARHLRKRGKEVFVVPNKLSRYFVKLGREAREIVAKESSSEKFRIGYFSGSASHDRDFLVITDVLLKILKKYPHVELFLAGPLELDKRFEEYSDRVLRTPYVSRLEHFANVARCNVNVAPLEIGDAYCEAKSAIKYYEAGLVGVPTIASATEVFQAAIVDGEVGFVAKDADEWQQKLEILIEDPDKAVTMGMLAFDDIEKFHTTDTKNVTTNNEDYYNFLSTCIDRSVARYLAPLQEAKKEIDTAVVIVNWNGHDYLRACLESLRKQVDQNFCVIVVDNGSKDGSRELLLKQYSEVAWIGLSKNEGFAHPTNCGIRAAMKNSAIRNIITLNNDASCDSDYIKKMRRSVQEVRTKKESIGALQPKVLNYYQKDHIDTTGMVTSFDLSALNRGKDEIDMGQYDKKQKVFGPSASAALYMREALESTMLPYDGYFDRSYFAYDEDVDLAWRLHAAGYDVSFVPEAIVYHVHSATGGNSSSFKAYHIHRNHFYNIIKNAPFFYLPVLAVFVPIRYILMVASLLLGKGPAARLDQTARLAETEGAISIVFRSWYDVVREIPTLISKRRYIMRRKKRSSWDFFIAIRKHYISLKHFIFH
jgi:GT2 family glycosyltransferase/glycosyltransferase involved in cell wall biosynthesis